MVQKDDVIAVGHVRERELGEEYSVQERVQTHNEQRRVEMMCFLSFSCCKGSGGVQRLDVVLATAFFYSCVTLKCYSLNSN